MGIESRTREQQAAADKESLNQRLADAQRTRLIDRFGRPVIEGGMYEYHPSLPLVFRVKSVKDMALMSSRVPPGSYTLELEATVMLPAMGGVPTAQLTLVEIGGGPGAMDTGSQDMGSQQVPPTGEDLRDPPGDNPPPTAPLKGDPDPDAPVRGKVATFPSAQRHE